MADSAHNETEYILVPYLKPTPQLSHPWTTETTGPEFETGEISPSRPRYKSHTQSGQHTSRLKV